MARPRAASPPLVSHDDVLAAAARIRGRCVRTPLLAATWSQPVPAWLKVESLQPTGAFKLRGATNAVAVLTAEQRARGVVTHSSGNHGSSLAYAARAAGVRVAVVVPHGAAQVKVDAVVAAGAELVRVDAADRVAACAEIAEDLPQVDTVLVPVGGGGLLSGVAVALRALVPGVRIIGCEPELAGDAFASFAAGLRVTLSESDTARTIADGLRSPSLGDLTWPHVQALVDDVVTVDEEAIVDAVRLLATGSRLVVEPSGAVAAAALMASGDRLPGGRTVVVVSGGNVDPAWFAATVQAASGGSR